MTSVNRSYNPLIFALDLPTFDQAAHYVDRLGGQVGLFKVGLELFVEAGPKIVRHILDNGRSGVFLDLKLHDIPATVSKAMRRIADMGVTFTTVHCGENQAMLEAATAAAGEVGVLGVTVLTSVSRRDLADAGYKQAYAEDVTRLVQKRARAAQIAGCAGVICSGKEVKTIKKLSNPGFLAVTPGIRPAEHTVGSDDQQRVTTAGQAIGDGADFLVVGRPIQQASNPLEMVRQILAEIETARAIFP